MDFTYEELREEEKRNIEIIETCAKKIQEIRENINNIDSIIEMIKNQGEIDKQIESIKKQMEAFDKINPLFGNDNAKAKEALAEKKERLSELKTLLIINQNGNESDIQMLERRKEEFENQKLMLEEEQVNAIELMKNIVAICNENVEALNHEISGKKTKQNAKSSQIGDIIEQYAELENELESFNKFNGFLTKKQQERIGDIESEKTILEEKLTKLMPNIKKEIVNKAKAAQLDAKFEAMEQREGKAINRKETIANSYKKVADEIINYLKGNTKENLTEKENKQEITNEKTIESEDINKEPISQKQREELEKYLNNDKNLEPEQKKSDISTTDFSSFNYLNNKTGIENSETFMVKDKVKKENKNAPVDKNTRITNDNWNKNEKDEFEYFFGTPVENKQKENLDQPIPQDKIEDLIYDEKNPKEINLDEPLTKEELNELSDVEFHNTKEEVKENNKENQDVSFKSEFAEFARALNLNPKVDENQENTLENEKENQQAMNDYIKELKKEAKELEIDKKIKRKVDKEKKQGRIKRFFTNVKRYFFESDELDEIELEEKEEKEKGGRTK